jgi:hypothetical protein
VTKDKDLFVRAEIVERKFANILFWAIVFLVVFMGFRLFIGEYYAADAVRLVDLRKREFGFYLRYLSVFYIVMVSYLVFVLYLSYKYIKRGE